jgi:hypothetical protein
VKEAPRARPRLGGSSRRLRSPKMDYDDDDNGQEPNNPGRTHGSDVLATTINSGLLGSFLTPYVCRSYLNQNTRSKCAHAYASRATEQPNNPTTQKAEPPRAVSLYGLFSAPKTTQH